MSKTVKHVKRAKAGWGGGKSIKKGGYMLGNRPLGVGKSFLKIFFKG